MSAAPLLTGLAFAAGAGACAASAALLWPRRARFGTAGGALVCAIAAAGLWATIGLVTGAASVATGMAGAARDLAWLLVVYRLFEIDGRIDSVRQLRPLVLVLGALEVLQIPLFGLFVGAGGAPQVRDTIFEIGTLFRLLGDVGGLVLVHNLYSGASGSARLALRWPAAALALMWGFDLNHFAIAYLNGGPSPTIAGLRGLLLIAVALLPTFGARRGSEALRVSPSRAVAFQSASLLLIAAYLAAMVVIARWLAGSGANFAAALQLGFVAAASLGALALLPSRRLRGWLRVTLTKHLFSHRYDYRAEWLRFTRTVAQSGASDASLEVRAIQAVADIADSPAGLLLAPTDQGRMALVARWQWPTADVPAAPLSPASVAYFERTGFVADLDGLRDGTDTGVDPSAVPDWVRQDPRAWALVPLLHFERLVGLVVLARPAYSRRLDWEDFDLFRVAGQQLASYLAERAGQQALAEAARFDDFNRRIAFVMHDIKNLASQLGLLVRNAELHADNPAFRADMLVTLRNAADKLNVMLGRLSRYGASSDEALGDVDAAQLAQAVVAQEQLNHPVHLVRADRCCVAARPEALEQALSHLVRNAIEASPAGEPVFVSVAADATHASLEVVDAGIGMTTEFVRNGLFKPFVSSKQAGFGIGAYEARELIRAMHGRLDVESREGLGSRFIIRLPLAAAAELLGQAGVADRRTA